jgi:hypothetical protein
MSKYKLSHSVNFLRSQSGGWEMSPKQSIQSGGWPSYKQQTGGWPKMKQQSGGGWSSNHTTPTLQ